MVEHQKAQNRLGSICSEDAVSSQGVKVCFNLENKKRVYYCDLCHDIEPMDFEAVIVHLLFHWRHPYQCSKCGCYLPRRKGVILRHMKKTHNVITSTGNALYDAVNFTCKKVWICGFRNCKKSFDTDVERNEHNRCVHHKYLNLSVKCNSCDKLFLSPNEVRLHKAVDHPKELDKCYPFWVGGKRISVGESLYEFKNFNLKKLKIVNRPLQADINEDGIWFSNFKDGLVLLGAQESECGNFLLLPKVAVYKFGVQKKHRYHREWSAFDEYTKFPSDAAYDIRVFQRRSTVPVMFLFKQILFPPRELLTSIEDCFERRKFVRKQLLHHCWVVVVTSDGTHRSRTITFYVKDCFIPPKIPTGVIAMAESLNKSIRHLLGPTLEEQMMDGDNCCAYFCYLFMQHVLNGNLEAEIIKADENFSNCV